MEKNVQFFVSWKDASGVARRIKSSQINYTIRQVSGKSTLLFVFPKVSVSQYIYLYLLFGTKAGG
ncbi:hypothetical protein ACAF76_015620 [Brevibacillus sp. TJ4]|uniref:hypothetical protein n=1 Tax=Brevibacillus sp. TJ4 TaxID=3234853 RepID=UPI0037D4DD94